MICARPAAASTSANRSSVNASASGSGPRVATRGTSRGFRTTEIDSDFFVPASVSWIPEPSSSPIRAAITRFRVVGSTSYQRIHPAFARWVTTCRSPRSMSRNLPKCVTSRTSRPITSDVDGSKVFSAENVRISNRATARPVRRWARSSASACTSGISGMD